MRFGIVKDKQASPALGRRASCCDPPIVSFLHGKPVQQRQQTSTRPPPQLWVRVGGLYFQMIRLDHSPARQSPPSQAHHGGLCSEGPADCLQHQHGGNLPHERTMEAFASAYSSAVVTLAVTGALRSRAPSPPPLPPLPAEPFTAEPAGRHSGLCLCSHNHDCKAQSSMQSQTVLRKKCFISYYIYNLLAPMAWLNMEHTGRHSLACTPLYKILLSALLRAGQRHQPSSASVHVIRTGRHLLGCPPYTTNCMHSEAVPCPST